MGGIRNGLRHGDLSQTFIKTAFETFFFPVLKFAES